MAYLIPKSARTVKMEIFKGLGIVDCLIVAVTVVAAYMILQIGALPFLPKAIIAVVLLIVGLILVLPSPIIPTQKSYQSLKTIYTYLSSSKDYKKRKVIRNGQKQQ